MLSWRKRALRQQQRCYESRWLHSLGSSTAVIEGTAPNPSYTLELNSVSCCDDTHLTKLINVCWKKWKDLLGWSTLTFLALLWWSDKLLSFLWNLSSLPSVFIDPMGIKNSMGYPPVHSIKVTRITLLEVMAAYILYIPQWGCSSAANKLLQKY